MKIGREADRLVINEEEVALVHRIFQLYADDHSLKQICKILNTEGISSPRARERGKYSAGIWNPSRLLGEVKLGEGILNNVIYIGRRVFNRRKWVEIPNENRGFSRRQRLNPESEWIVRYEPDLRIIDQQLWDRVKALQAEARAARDVNLGLIGNPLAGPKRAAYFSQRSGALRRLRRRFRQRRRRCKAANRQARSNSSITSNHLEERALSGLRDRLLTPDIICGFAVHLQRELDAEQRAAYGRRNELEDALVETRQRAAKILRRVEEDEAAPRPLTTRLKALGAEEEQLERELAELPERTVIRLPTNYEAIYRTAIAELKQHLATREANVSLSAIRALIEGVVVHAGNCRGGKHRRLELHGDLFQMVALTEAAVAGSVKVQNARKAQFHGTGGLDRTLLVAGAGFEPATFRL